MASGLKVGIATGLSLVRRGTGVLVKRLGRGFGGAMANSTARGRPAVWRPVRCWRGRRPTTGESERIHWDAAARCGEHESISNEPRARESYVALVAKPLSIGPSAAH